MAFLEEEPREASSILFDMEPPELNAVLTKENSILFSLSDLEEIEKKANVEIHGINLNIKGLKKIEVDEPIKAQDWNSNSDVEKIVVHGSYSWIIHTKDGKKYLLFY